MKKKITGLLGLLVMMLTAWSINAQTYEPSEISQLKTFLRQSDNVQQLGVDTTSWGSQNTWLASLQGVTFKDSSGITHVKTIDWAGKGLTGNLYFNKFRALEQVDFSNNNLENIQLQLDSSLFYLKAENLLLLKTIDVDASIYLKEISLRNCEKITSISTIAVSSGAKMLNSLEKLDLSGCKAITSIPSLRMLSLKYLDISGIAKGVASVSSNFLNTKGLVELYCSDFNLAQLQVYQSPDLKKVVARNTLIKALGASTIPSPAPKLEEIDLQGCSLLADLSAITDATKVPVLQKLNIANTAVPNLVLPTRSSSYTWVSVVCNHTSTLSFKTMPAGSVVATGSYLYYPQDTLRQNAPYKWQFDLSGKILPTSSVNWFELNGTTETPITVGPEVTSSGTATYSFTSAAVGKTYRCKITDPALPLLTMVADISVNDAESTFPYVALEITALKDFLRCPSATQYKKNFNEFAIDTTNWDTDMTWVPKVTGLTFLDKDGKKFIQTVNWTSGTASPNLSGSIRVNNFAEVNTVDITGTKLDSIFVTNCPAFTKLTTATTAKPATALKTVELANNPKQIALAMSGSTYVDKLTITNCPAMTSIILDNIAAKSLTFNDFAVAETLSVKNAPYLEEVIFGTNVDVKKVWLDDTPKLTKVDNLTQLSSLVEFLCTRSDVKNLNFNNLGELTTVTCNVTPLETVSVNNCAKLQSLKLSEGGKLTTLDLSTISTLKVLDIKNCKLTSLDLSNNSSCSNTMSNVSGNKLRFSTMNILNKITYTPQNEIAGGTVTTVDLSAEATATSGTASAPSTFTWFEMVGGSPVALLSGVTTTATGKFSFAPALAGKELLCRITNSIYPALTLDYKVTIAPSCPAPQNVTAQLHSPQWYNVNLTWSAPPDLSSTATGGEVLIDNGSCVTNPGVGRNGADYQARYGAAGWGGDIKYRHSKIVLDDFTLTEDSNIDFIEFFAGVWNDASVGTTSPIDQVYVFICNGDPSKTQCDTIWGDFTTNRFVSSEFANIYSGADDGSYQDVSSPVFKTKAAVHTTLPAGKYWVCVALDEVRAGSVSLLVPPVNPNTVVNGNSKVGSFQTIGDITYTTWSDFSGQTKSGETVKHDIPFKIYGSKVQGNLTGYNIYRDGVKLNTTPVAELTYQDLAPGAGNYGYGITSVWSDGCESSPGTITVTMPVNQCSIPITAYPYHEGFEKQNGSESAPPTCWEQEFVKDQMVWERINKRGTMSPREPYFSHSGDYKMTFFYNLSFGGMGATTRLISPKFDISGLNKPVLQFWYTTPEFVLSGKNTGQIDSLVVYYKNSPTGEWIPIEGIHKRVDMWTQRIIELPNPTGTYWLAFEAVCRFGDGIQLDDITITDGQAVLAPANLTANVNKQYVGLTWDAPAGQTPTGYLVYRDGDLLANVTAANFVDNNAQSGHTYNYCVVAFKDTLTNISVPLCTNVAVPVYSECNGVNDLLVAMSTDHKAVNISWAEPARLVNTIGYCTNIKDLFGASSGTASDLVAAIRFSSADLKNLHLGGKKLSKVRFVSYATTSSYTVQVWVGGSESAPGTLVASQDVKATAPLAWNEIALTSAIAIDDSKELWIGYRANTTKGYPIVADAGPAVTGKADLLYNNGAWSTLKGANWCIEGVVTNNGASPASAMQQPILAQSPAIGKGSIMSLPASEEYLSYQNAKDIPMIQSAERPVSYELYRNGTLLGTTIDLQYVDNTVPEGSHTYCVKAIHGSGSNTCSSSPVCADIQVTIKYVITATAGANGSISPSGTVLANKGSNHLFTITPNDGYWIKEILVDGVSTPSAISTGRYTFANVNADHTIDVLFGEKYTITATAGANGIIDPSGTVFTTFGDNKTFTIVPEAGYKISQVLVDGINNTSAVTAGSYTFSYISANHSIAASFVAIDPVLDNLLINGNPVEAGQVMHYTANCGENNVTLHFTVDGMATVNGLPYTPGMSIALTNAKNLIVISTTSNAHSRYYTLVVAKALGGSVTPIIVQRWGNILAVVNNPKNNGGFVFDDYKWYKSGSSDVIGTGGYISFTGNASDYSVDVHAVQTGEWHHICSNINRTAPAGITVYPNPVAAGHELKIVFPEGMDKANVRIYDVNGMLVRQQSAVNGVTMPNQIGFYIVEIQLPDGTTEVQKVIVK